MYDAAIDSCPNAPAFLSAIRSRTDRARVAAPDESAVTLDVKIARGSSGQVVGRLEIREPDGARQLRAVESPTCADVAKALALVVALYLDPDAEDRQEERQAPPPPVPSRPPPPPAPAGASRQSETSVRFGVGGAVGFLGGLGPSMAPMASVFADAKVASALPSWFQPSFRLSIDGATTGADVGPGSQRYLLLGGALNVCPIELAFVRAFHLGPCAGMMVGLHRGTSDGIPNARGQDKPWLTPTATAKLGWAVTDAVTLELEGGFVVPLQPTRFFLAPDLTLFRTPELSGRANMAVLVRFQ